jgi:hypothetical protein
MTELVDFHTYELDGMQLVAHWNRKSEYWCLFPGNPFTTDADYVLLGRLLIRLVRTSSGATLRGTRFTREDLKYIGEGDAHKYLADAEEKRGKGDDLDMAIWGNVFGDDDAPTDDIADSDAS